MSQIKRGKKTGREKEREKKGGGRERECEREETKSPTGTEIKMICGNKSEAT